ncbi:uncharacterized protein LAESUDRAFT_746495 [Laetiporus sulphureus 93-53]|uniref:Uncharacterized protein n=1 Tax=Laetiporus sulphureus 93-53 TaxID=1314785 RepID=A0A165IJD0_9APHY|nr:uncharacterized protein LAESUDRAFT_746495 [Laetiporus sulphureus 93-53]KZT13159.1 hypothetical protein LAESUDRAFT_746495 [Laetiporus sulphureus 93-53]
MLPSVAVMSSSPSRAALSCSPQRRTPPPPPINLDDCKGPPRIPATRSSASPTSTSKASTSFVFTSSRLHLVPGYASHPPAPCSPMSPLADIGSTSAASAGQRSRPALTQHQLAKHSEGAIDARTILGPNMRAAGFVHLAQAVASSPHHQAQRTPSSPPSTPSAGHPTPTDPPPFPPIMFLSPTAVTKTPLWDYQRGEYERGAAWPMGSKEVARLSGVNTRQTTNVENSVEGSSSSAADTGTRPKLGSKRSTSSTIVSSSSTLLSPSSTITASGSPSVSSSASVEPSSSPPSPKLPTTSPGTTLKPSPVFDAPRSPERKTKGKERALEEYPFPQTGVSKTAPPSPSTPASPTRRPLMGVPSFSSATLLSHASRRSGKERQRSGTRDQPDTSSPHEYVLSLSELCVSPPPMWTATMFAPNSSSSSSSPWPMSRAASSGSGSSCSWPPSELRVKQEGEETVKGNEKERQGEAKPRVFRARERVGERGRDTVGRTQKQRDRPGPDKEPQLSTLSLPKRPRVQRRHSYGFAHVPRTKTQTKSVASDLVSDAETMVDTVSVSSRPVTELASRTTSLLIGFIGVRPLIFSGSRALSACRLTRSSQYPSHLLSAFSAHGRCVGICDACRSEAAPDEVRTPATFTAPQGAFAYPAPYSDSPAMNFKLNTHIRELAARAADDWAKTGLIMITSRGRNEDPDSAEPRILYARSTVRARMAQGARREVGCRPAPNEGEDEGTNVWPVRFPRVGRKIVTEIAQRARASSSTFAERTEEGEDQQFTCVKGDDGPDHENASKFAHQKSEAGTHTDTANGLPASAGVAVANSLEEVSRPPERRGAMRGDIEATNATSRQRANTRVDDVRECRGALSRRFAEAADRGIHDFLLPARGWLMYCNEGGDHGRGDSGFGGRRTAGSNVKGCVARGDRDE